MTSEKKKGGGILGKLFAGGKSKGGPQEEMFELEVDLHRQQDGLGIGLTLDNIIVEVEAGGSVAAQGELLYGDQIIMVDSVSLQVTGLPLPPPPQCCVSHWLRASDMSGCWCCVECSSVPSAPGTESHPPRHRRRGRQTRRDFRA